MIRSAMGLSDHMREAVFCREAGGKLTPATRGRRMRLAYWCSGSDPG